MKHPIIYAMCLAGVGIPVVATAQQAAVTVVSSDTVPAREVSPFGETAPVENRELNKVTGQSDLAQVVSAQNTSTVSGNTVTGNSQTGTIHFDSSSFQNLNGLSLLSANTGNNVSINSSLNVNVAINR
jgi:hypothetical protein